MLDENLRSTNALVVETFDNNCHVFEFVSDMDRPYLILENDSKHITQLVIKPDLWVYFENGGYEHGTKLLKPLDCQAKKVLAKDFFIDPAIFHSLVNYKLISYSKAMADLYQLPVAYSRDIGYHHNDYKRKEPGKKEKVLAKLREGSFN